MAGLVRCRIVDMPDGHFAVMALLASGKVFRRKALATLAEAEEAVECLRDVMAACGAPVVVEVSAWCGARNGYRIGQAAGGERGLDVSKTCLGSRGTGSRTGPVPPRS